MYLYSILHLHVGFDEFVQLEHMSQHLRHITLEELFESGVQCGLSVEDIVSPMSLDFIQVQCLQSHYYYMYMHLYNFMALYKTRDFQMYIICSLDYHCY